jgi:two-component system OmpR family sensor kinase
VTVRLTPERESVRVEVADDGPGIPSPDLPRIFEPFYRGGQAASSVQGTGLGLTIVRAILDQHHSPISVQRLLERGTAFTFALPVARIE